MLVITPNLCLDVTISLPELRPGTVMRARHTVTTAGGKGVNVVRAARILGSGRLRLASFVPEQDGQRLIDLLHQEGTQLLAVGADGPVRITTIFLEGSGRASVINGRGPKITATQWRQLLDLVAESLRPGETLICSGSLPPGVPEDGYAQLVALAHRTGGYALVDAAPRPLRAALAFAPDLVTPNLAEAEGLLWGTNAEPVDETGPDIAPRASAAAAALHAAGARRAVVTAGSMGAALCTAAGSWWFDAPPVKVVSPIGAGDTFLGGAALALEAGAEDQDIVRHGMAAASASCETGTAGELTASRAAELFAQIAAHQ